MRLLPGDIRRIVRRVAAGGATAPAEARQSAEAVRQSHRRPQDLQQQRDEARQERDEWMQTAAANQQRLGKAQRRAIALAHGAEELGRGLAAALGQRDAALNAQRTAEGMLAEKDQAIAERDEALTTIQGLVQQLRAQLAEAQRERDALREAEGRVTALETEATEAKRARAAAEARRDVAIEAQRAAEAMLTETDAFINAHGQQLDTLGERVKGLQAQLAAVEAERDALRAASASVLPVARSAPIDADRVAARELFASGMRGRAVAEDLGLPLDRVSGWAAEWEAERRAARGQA